ncbi:MAG: glycosyltransferase family 4 protein [Chloroflexota bacterium]|nr:glycosyltransferase family 4 protein [Chloroflexota bacterium]
MRVLMISKALVNGAYQRKAEELAKLPGVELMVVVPPAWIQEGKPIRLDRAYTAGYELAVEPMALNGHFHLHWYPLLRRRFAAFRPQLVHIDEEAYNLSTFQALRLGRHFGSRSLFFTWQNIERRYPWPFSAFEQYVLSQADGCIAGNQAAAAIQRKRGFRRDIAVIPQFGIDPELFVRRETASRSHFTVGFSGRLVAAKGLWVLCQAFERLPENCRLLLIGRGPLEGPLVERAKRAGWADRLTVAAAPSREMPELYSRMDCLVLPSLTTAAWKEQFGRALIEAMACGVPVIGSDSGEIPNLIGENGLICPEGDAEALAGAIGQLLQQPEKRRALAAAGRTRVLERYTQQHVARATYEVYLRSVRP